MHGQLRIFAVHLTCCCAEGHAAGDCSSKERTALHPPRHRTGTRTCENPLSVAMQCGDEPAEVEWLRVLWGRVGWGGGGRGVGRTVFGLAVQAQRRGGDAGGGPQARREAVVAVAGLEALHVACPGELLRLRHRDAPPGHAAVYNTSDKPG